MWKPGERSELAQKAGISRSHLCNILGRRCRANAELAIKLEKACQDMRLMIAREDWAFNKETDNPYFKRDKPCVA